MKHKVEWVDSGHEPQVKPNPLYPKGQDLDVSGKAAKTCTVPLPYPAKRIGGYVIECEECGIRVGCTTAGRPDDPRSIKIACYAHRDMPPDAPPVFKHDEASCPFCNKPLDAMSSARGDPGIAPRPGDVSLCIYCGEWLVFETGWKMRKPTDKESEEFAADWHMQRVRAAWAATRGGTVGPKPVRH